MQLLHRLVTDVDPTDHRSLLSPLLCAGTVVGAALTPSLLSKSAVLLLLGVEAWFLPPVAAVLAVTFPVHLHDARTADVAPPTAAWLLTPLLFPLYGLAAVKAVIEYLLGRDEGWYSVETRGAGSGR